MKNGEEITFKTKSEALRWLQDKVGISLLECQALLKFVNNKTLRDYFAGQALSVCGDSTACTAICPRSHAEEVAKYAYGIADAMLKERSKENDQEEKRT